MSSQNLQPIGNTTLFAVGSKLFFHDKERGALIVLEVKEELPTNQVLAWVKVTRVLSDTHGDFYDLIGQTISVARSWLYRSQK